MPLAIEGEHLPTEVGYDAELQSGQDLGEDDDHADEFHLRRLLIVCAKVI
jgi:hypothetical protein